MKTSNRTSRFLSAVGYGVVNRFASLVNHAFIVTCAIPFLGAELFGVWAIATATLAWISLGNFGIGLGLISQLSNRDPSIEIRPLVATNFYMLCCISVALAVTCLPCIALLPFPSALNNANISPTTIRFLLLASAALACLTIPLSIGYAVFQGLQRGDIAAKTSSVAILSATALCFLATQVPVDKITFCVLMTLAVSASSFAQFLLAVRLRHIVLSPILFDRRIANSSLRLGLGFFASSAFSLCFNQGGVLIAGAFLQPEAATTLDTMNRVSMVIYSLVGTVIWPIWPSFGDAIAKREIAWLRKAFFLSLAVPLIPCGTLLVAGAYFGPDLISYLTSGEVKMTRRLLLFTLINATLVSIYMPLQTLLGAAKMIKPQIFAGIIQTLTFFCLSALLIPKMDVSGIPLAQCLTMALVTIPLLTVSCKRVLAFSTHV